MDTPFLGELLRGKLHLGLEIESPEEYQSGDFVDPRATEHNSFERGEIKLNCDVSLAFS
jgi:hypothetical protein